MTIKNKFNVSKKIITTLLFVLVLSFVIEVVQSLLPTSFFRGFDLIDIGFSLLGGLLGVIIA